VNVITAPAWLFWLPAAIALAAACAGLAADAAGRRAGALAIIFFGLAGAAGVAAYTAWMHPVQLALGDAFVVGRGFAGVTALGYLIAALGVLAGGSRLSRRSNGPGIGALMAFLAIASQALASALDLLSVLIALEIVAVGSYAVIAGARTDRSDEAAVRYFVQGAVATSLAVLGLALVHAFGGGAVDYGTLAVSMAQAPARPALLAMALLLAVFAFKLGAFPFHAWVPDAYETSEASGAAVLSSVPKVAALAAMFVLFRGAVFEADAFAVLANLAAALATASIVVGNLGALRQSSFARMLGYSGVAQVGYALIGLSAGDAGAGRAVLFGATYAVSVAAAFICAEALAVAEPRWNGTVAGMKGLGRRHPLIGVALAASMLSLTGIPLLIGFWGKLLVFLSAVGEGWTWLVIVGVIGSVVSFGYYGRVLKVAYFEEPDEALAVLGDEPGARGGSAAWAAAIAILLVIGGGVAPVAFGIEPMLRLLAVM